MTIKQWIERLKKYLLSYLQLKKTKQQFIKEAKSIHGNKYDYRRIS